MQKLQQKVADFIFWTLCTRRVRKLCMVECDGCFCGQNPTGLSRLLRKRIALKALEDDVDELVVNLAVESN